MTEVNIQVFSKAIDIVNLFAEARQMPMFVVETDRTLGLRPFTRGVSVGLTIPKSRPSSRGLSYTRGEMASDESDGVALGSFLSVQELKLRLRGVRTRRRRGDTTMGEVTFDTAADPMLVLWLYDPGTYQPVSVPVGWTPNNTPPRLPVYLSASSGGSRISASTLKALGTAGHKMSPQAVWTVSDGRWEMQSPEGSTLRVATWPTNTQEGSS